MRWPPDYGCVFVTVAAVGWLALLGFVLGMLMALMGWLD
jgi:hypothetical protein